MNKLEWCITKTIPSDVYLWDLLGFKNTQVGQMLLIRDVMKRSEFKDSCIIRDRNAREIFTRKLLGAILDDYRYIEHEPTIERFIDMPHGGLIVFDGGVVFAMVK